MSGKKRLYHGGTWFYTFARRYLAPRVREEWTSNLKQGEPLTCKKTVFMIHPHVSFWDPIIIAAFVDGLVHAWAKAESFTWWNCYRDLMRGKGFHYAVIMFPLSIVFPILMRNSGSLPIVRRSSARKYRLDARSTYDQTRDKSLQILSAGGCIGGFPSGTRGGTKWLPGLYDTAVQADAKIVLVALLPKERRIIFSNPIVARNVQLEDLPKAYTELVDNDSQVSVQ